VVATCTAEAAHACCEQQLGTLRQCCNRSTTWVQARRALLLVAVLWLLQLQITLPPLQALSG
jgi:hypothetical protein